MDNAQPLASNEVAHIKRPQKVKRLTKRQKKLIAIMAKDPLTPLKEAGCRSGYSKSHAAAEASRSLKSKNVREVFRDALLQAGLTPNEMAARIEEASKANKTHFFAHDGRVRDTRETIDHSTRLASIELASKLMGAVGPTIEMNFTPANPLAMMEDDELQALIAKGKELAENNRALNATKVGEIGQGNGL